MEEMFELGTINCPSGTLVIIDGGYLGLWSGERSPADVDPAALSIEDSARAADVTGALDFEVTGPDAAEAVRTFDRQPGSMTSRPRKPPRSRRISLITADPPAWTRD
ncbi:hypothetical protein [Streptomyces sp. AM 2-1-1]|uniref:hypothetical protein n=1 Tax=Streptomyces sp. AM 2-1-1 TaxID=3028709 RepID=UPI0023B8E2E7|nr:hypothetical protein [Streptomyces sp. AM 2-1-1]WEH42880.1 hypothetical protein PZB77_27150 [Streptomyces sp. AM 2-1-1]